MAAAELERYHLGLPGRTSGNRVILLGIPEGTAVGINRHARVVPPAERSALRTRARNEQRLGLHLAEGIGGYAAACQRLENDTRVIGGIEVAQQDGAAEIGQVERQAAAARFWVYVERARVADGAANSMARWEW